MKPSVWRQVVLFVSVAAVSQLCCIAAADEATEKLVEIDLETWQEAQAEGRKLLLLLYKTDGCDLCAQAVEEVNMILGQPEIPYGVELGKSEDPALLSKLGFKSVPTLVFLRDKSYVTYDGVELGKSEDPALLSKLGFKSVPTLVFLRDKSYVTYDGEIEVESMLHWIPLAAEVTVRDLGDKSFEHLTQASTGATTGDWLVAFSGPDCRDVTSMLDSVGVSFKGKVNVALVNMPRSPELVQRFQIKHCPHLIYFRRGKMYRYDLPTLDTASLRSFLDGFYKNSKAENVPIPKSQFDYITEGVADFLKKQLRGDNRNVAIAAVCAVAVSFLVVIILCCRSVVEPPSKKKGE
ncbi:hypothetical protein EGW08_009413 [Elysia chlorotica]|uniref:Thioredoxin domain-containing protein n=1 Tax=Elysia chlorotica TaxID=188477 RepID=A0A433TMM9_ELYCH|nr:hypothetical protein EGW08_009413 [Elysia chlorotica]